MITFEALDVILRVQNLPGFMARMRAGANSVKQIGTAAVSTTNSASAAILSAAKKATLGLTAMAAIATATGYKQSVEFEKQLTLVHTQAGATMAEMKAFKAPLLELAKTLPQGPIELAKGLYHIKSIGVPAAQALDALKVAAEGAMVGNADLEQTTSALGAAWLAGINGAGSFRHTMAILNATVGAGNMRMDELVTALGTGVLPTAKLAGLGIQDVMAALALLKDEGYGAYGAMAQFATALHFFTSPTKKASDAFKQLGLRDLDLADTMRKRGMVAALALLRDRLHLTSDEMARASKTGWAPETQQERILGAILPGGRGRVFRVLLNQIDRYGMKLNQIDKTSGRFAEAIKTTQATAANRLHTAWSSVQVDLVRLGDTIRNNMTNALVFALGIFTKFLEVLIGIPGAIRAIINFWNQMPAPLKVIVTLLGIMAAEYALFRGIPVVIEALAYAWIAVQYAIEGAWAASVAFLATNAWLLIIMAVIAGIVLLVIKWKWLRTAGVDAFNWIKTAAVETAVWVAGAFMKVWGVVSAVFMWIYHHWRLLAVILGGPIGVFVVLFVNSWHRIKDAAASAWNWIVGHWRTILSLAGPFGKLALTIIDNWHSIRKAGVSAWHGILHAMQAAVRWIRGAWGSIKNSGFVHFMSKVAGWNISHLKTGVRAIGSGADAAERALGGHPGGWTGGLVTAGGFMDVGEHGRERIYVPTGSRIAPAGFRAMPGGAGSAAGGSASEVMEVHSHVYLDGKQISENVSHHMANKKARK